MAQIEDNAFEFRVLRLEFAQGLGYVLASVAREGGEVHISHALGDHAGVGHVFRFNFGALQADAHVFGTSRSAHGQLRLGAGEAAQEVQHFFGAAAFGVLAVDGHNGVTHFQACFLGRTALVDVGDHHIIAHGFARSAKTGMSAFRLDAVEFDVCFGDVIGKRVEFAEHGVHGVAHHLTGVQLIYITVIDLLVCVGKQLKVFGDVEVLGLGSQLKTGQQGNEEWKFMCHSSLDNGNVGSVSA